MLLWKSPSPFKKYFYLAKIKSAPVFNSLDKHHPIYMRVPNKMGTSLKPVFSLYTVYNGMLILLTLMHVYL